MCKERDSPRGEGHEYFDDEIRGDPVSAHNGGSPVVRQNRVQNFEFSDFDTL